MIRRLRLRTLALSLLITLGAGGCAQNPTTADGIYDPLEPTNRAIYGFNETLDTYALEPVSDGYAWITPAFFRKGVDNFFSNLAYPGVILNDFLQGKVEQGLRDINRFTLNTTIGLLGILDPAGAMGLEENNEDFGQTLGTWGAGPGAYLVIPALGPNTARDSTNLVASYGTNLTTYIPGDLTLTLGLYALNFINQRTLLDKAATIRDEAALDPYAFTRSAYLQYRRNLVYDGNPPLEFNDDDMLDEYMNDGGE